MQAFPSDSRLPALPAAVDPAVMQAVFRRLCEGSPERTEVLACRVARVQYRPETRCSIQYAVTVRHLDSGSVNEQWLTGALSADRGRVARSARRAEAALAVPGSGLSHRALFLPEMQMLLSVFPQDAKLPYAKVLVAGRDRALVDALLGAFGGGRWEIRRWAVAPVRYHERRSLLVRYTITAADIETGRTRDKVFYAKAYSDAKGARQAFDQVSRMAHHAAEAGLGLRVVPAVALLDELNAVVHEAAAGTPLVDVLRSGERTRMVEAVRATARAMAQLNTSEAPMTRRSTAADRAAQVRQAAALLECAAPDLSSQLRCVTAAAGAVGPEPADAPTHGDMKPEHVLVGAGHPAFVDLDSCAAGDPVRDPALMLARFSALAAGHADRDRMQEAAAIFKQQYFARVPAEWRARLPVQYAGALVEVASGMFQRQEYAWKVRTASLVTEAASLARAV